MMSEGLDEEFEKAYTRISLTNEKIAPDDLLRLYAYYKQATEGKAHASISQSTDLIQSFKFNAWKQVHNLTQKEAKIEYIELSKKILK